MIDTTSLLDVNLTEAFKQINQYLALGILTSISALALHVAPRSNPNEPYSVQGLPPMDRDAATLVLLGIAFVAGVMGSYAAESAAGIVNRLRSSQDVLAAAC